MMKPIDVEHQGMPGGGASLLERTNAERDEQVAALFDRHYVPMCRLAFVILGDHALAEEIVMEALLKTFAGWGRLRDIDRADAYLRRAVVNLCRSRIRRKMIEARVNAEARIAFGEGSVWVVSGSNGDGELVQIDPAKDEVVGRFGLSGGPFAVAAGDGWLWVTDEGGDRIMRIDPKAPGGTSSTP